MNSAGNVMRLQQEAAARVQRLQEHSRRLVREHPVNVYRGVTPAPPVPRRPEPEATPCTDAPAPPPTGTALETLLQGDQEQSLVLLLAVLLAKNGAPIELVLALLYIAM